MFLVVFVTLMTSIIALFSQALMIQTAKIHAAEMGMMQTIVRWHVAATAQIKRLQPTTMPCQTTWGTTLKIPPPSQNPNTLFTIPTCKNASNQNMLVSDEFNVSKNGQWVKTYGTTFQYSNPFSFMTQAFKNMANTYVITYINPASATGSNLEFPDKTLGADPNPTYNYFTNISNYYFNDLVQQFSVGVPPDINYGIVETQGVLAVRTVGPNAPTPTLSYTIPASVPTGSLALISVAN